MSRWLFATVLLMGLTAQSSAQVFLGKNAKEWLDQLKNGNEAQRRNAAFALGKIGNQAALAASDLKKAIRDDASPKVQEAAALALGEIGGQSLQIGQDEDAVETLKQALKSPKEQVRKAAACGLGHFGKNGMSAQSALAEALGDNNPGVRQNAAWALGQLGPSSVKYLQIALADSDRFVKRDGANALATMDGDQIRILLDDLSQLCAVNDTEVRRAALAALAKTVGEKDASVGPHIEKALADKDLEVRGNAALTLSNIGGKTAQAALPILRDLLHKGNKEMRANAALGIRKLGPEGEPALADLIRALRDTDPKVRGNAAHALGGSGSRAAQAVPHLVKLIGDEREDLEARQMAGQSLQEIGNVPAAVEAVPALLKILEDPRQVSLVREKITWALRAHQGRLASMDGVLAAFTKVVKEPLRPGNENKMVRYDCAYLLALLHRGSAPDEALDTLQDFLHDNTVVIFLGSDTTVGTGGNEVKGTNAKVVNVGKGDGRKMALDAISSIGLARIKTRPKIIEQIRLLSRNMDPDFDPRLRESCKKFLSDNGL